MARSRSWYLTSITDMMDANNHPRFPSSILTLHLGAVHFSEWGDLLEENPDLRTQTFALTRDSQGRIPLSSLSSGNGTNAEKNFNRVLYVCDTDGHEYPKYDFSDAPQAANTEVGAGVGRRGWYLDGDYVQITPVEARDISIRVNHTPTAAHDLAADTDTLEWPDGHEYVLILETAGLALMKGGAETQASLEMKGQARIFRQKLYQRLRRLGAGPSRMKHSDDAFMWGGQ